MKDGVQFFSYVRLMVGHEGCDVARWVWLGSGAVRVFADEWVCPVCRMYMGTDMTMRTVQVDVPVGCLFVEKEVEV